MVALTERDEAVTRHEVAAGEALIALTRDEGLTLNEACEWSDDLSRSEARRLRRAAEVAEGFTSTEGEGNLRP